MKLAMIKILAVAVFLPVMACTTTVPQGPTDEESLRPAKIEYEDLSGGYTDYKVENLTKYPGWNRHDDWYVKALHDDMDTSTHVRLFATFSPDPVSPLARFPGWDKQTFGFEIFGGSLVILSPSLAVGGRRDWPLCDFDSASMSINGSKPVLIADVESPAFCNRVDLGGELIQSMKESKAAKVKVFGQIGFVSLDGFKEALAEALRLSGK